MAGKGLVSIRSGLTTLTQHTLFLEGVVLVLHGALATPPCARILISAHGKVVISAWEVQYTTLRMLTR